MFYITTPLPYANGKPHLGHLLEAITTDTFARFYKRIHTDRVFLQMGIDQFGLKIYEKALEEGKDTQQYVDEFSQGYKELLESFDIVYDGYVETSSAAHKVVTQLVWKKLLEKGFIYKKSYLGQYCKGCEDFYAPSQLVEGKCPVHRSELVEMNEENYFFKLSHFKTEIQDFLKRGSIKPAYIAKEQLNFVEELQDVSISREKSRLPWGVPVPGDSEQVMYVWFDAVLNYLTAVVDEETMDQATEFPYLAEDAEQAIFDEIREAFPIDLMYVSKEIAKFHVVIFIGILLGLELELPKQTLAHGLINDKNGHKFSKSLNNGVLPEELVAKFGIDGTRFIMLHEINIDGDTNFDWETITNAFNSHLANNIGNLLMRVTTLVEKNYDGFVDIYEVYDKPYKFDKVYEHLHNLDPKLALDAVLDGARWGNELLEQTKPWTLIKDGKDKEAKEILAKLCVLLWDLSEVISIFMPATGEKIHKIITAEKIEKAEPLFQKVELEVEIDN
jgi:methionyl-tRNA synthetase